MNVPFRYVPIRKYSLECPWKSNRESVIYLRIISLSITYMTIAFGWRAFQAGNDVWYVFRKCFEPGAEKRLAMVYIGWSFHSGRRMPLENKTNGYERISSGMKLRNFHFFQFHTRFSYWIHLLKIPLQSKFKIKIKV